MAEIGYLENGIRSKTANPKRRKRRNTTKTTSRAKATNPARRRRRRNPATAYGMSAVSNPRRRRRRNPVVAKSANPKRRRRRNGIKRSRNGIFGNSRETVTAVMSLAGGMVGTKIVAGLISPFAARVLTPVGLGSYTQVIVQGALALVAVSPVASKLAGRDAGKFAMLGGLTITALDLIDMVLPDNVPLNPFNAFNNQPVIVPQGQLSADAAVNGALSGTSNYSRVPAMEMNVM